MSIIVAIHCFLETFQRHTAVEIHKLLPASVTANRWSLYTGCPEHVTSAGAAGGWWQHFEEARTILLIIQMVVWPIEHRDYGTITPDMSLQARYRRSEETFISNRSSFDRDKSPWCAMLLLVVQNHGRPFLHHWDGCLLSFKVLGLVQRRCHIFMLNPVLSLRLACVPTGSANLI